MQDRQAKFKPVILMQDIDADYQVLDLGLMVILDKSIKKVGIWIPETPLGNENGFFWSTADLQSLMKAIIFELFYYINGFFRV